MFAAFMSRWMISFECAASRAIGSFHAQTEHRLDFQRLASDPVPERLPLSSSMTMKVRPSDSSISWNVRMFGWFRMT
jgi:hypothetical protein